MHNDSNLSPYLIMCSGDVCEQLAQIIRSVPKLKDNNHSLNTLNMSWCQSLEFFLNGAELSLNSAN